VSAYSACNPRGTPNRSATQPALHVPASECHPRPNVVYNRYVDYGEDQMFLKVYQTTSAGRIEQTRGKANINLRYYLRVLADPVEACIFEAGRRGDFPIVSADT